MSSLMPQSHQILMATVSTSFGGNSLRQSGKTIHIVCEVHDSGPFRLVAYKRIILDVE